MRTLIDYLKTKAKLPLFPPQFELECYTKVNMIPVIIVILFLIAIVTYVHQKLTYWQRQGIVTVPWYACFTLKEPFHLMDQKLCQKYGKIVG